MNFSISTSNLKTYLEGLDKFLKASNVRLMNLSPNASENFQFEESKDENQLDLVKDWGRKIIEVAKKYKYALMMVAALSVNPNFEAKGQSQALDIDYTEHSNILNPDTLSGDQKAIFWHFVKLTSEEAKALEAAKIKEEFGKLGLTTAERQRFIDAFTFYASTMTAHKISCENWAEFKYLKPKEEE